MIIRVAIQEQVRVPKFIPPLLRRVIRRTLHQTQGNSPLTVPPGCECFVDAVLVDSNTIQEMNQQFRKIDAPTDVLSFPMYEAEESLDASMPIVLGDVVLCPSEADEHALELHHSLAYELAFMVAHGTLHLLGWTHDVPEALDAMNAQVERVLEEVIGTPDCSV